MFQGGCLRGCFGHVDALGGFDLDGFLGAVGGEGLEEVGGREDCGRALFCVLVGGFVGKGPNGTYLKSLDERCSLVDVRLDDFDTLGS